MVRRLASIALMGVTCAGLGGCAASRVGRTPQAGLNTVRPAINSPAVADLVERHNKNAQLVTSLEAAPSVSAKSRLSGGGGRGNMVFERDHNFRFVVEGGMGSKHYADIGSNDDEFWFWADDKQDRHVYVARYDAAAKPGGAELAFQPDWIVEALGLHVITPEEQGQITVKPNDRETPGTDAWIHHRRTLRGESVNKVTIVDRATGQIREHRFFAPGIARPVASATPIGVTEATLTDAPESRVRLPKQIHLKLAPTDPKQTPLEMDLVLGGLKVNAPLSQAKRDELFAVPEIAGSPIYRLDDPVDRAQAEPGTPRPRPRGRTETRQSAPAPPAGSGVELGDPSPMGTDGAYLRRSDPMPLSPDLGGDPDKAASSVVGAPLPQAPENPAERLARRTPVGP